MRKSKGQTIDSLYTNNEESDKKVKRKSSKNKKSKTQKEQDNQRINLDNEIIIGLTPKKEEIKKEKKQKTKQKKESKKSPQKNNKKNGKNTRTKTKNKTINPNKKKKIKIIKWITIIMLFILAVILFMLSSVFNIKQIVVINNSKVPTEEIINLSQLSIDTNMFKTLNGTIKNNIKANAYIEDVSIKRNLNGTITLDIKERIPTYMLKLENTYVYINNQGYMLEISENPLKLPVISGYSTPSEEIKAGNRLIVDDLNKLDDVIKIIEASKNTPLANLITEIDISNSTDYKLKISSEKKTISFGNLTNINIKLQMAGKVLSSEKGKKGEIYFQNNAKKAVFREDV